MSQSLLEHVHAPHGHRQSMRHLLAVLVLTGSFLVIEVVGARLTGSLALLADAGHMLSDTAALVLALLGAWYASKPPTRRASYGLVRAEVLAAAINGLVLVGVGGYVLWEAVGRLLEPPEVQTVPVLLIASAGLAVNLIGARILARDREHDLNVEGAFLHVLSDALGSVGVIVAAVVMLATGWQQVDAIAGMIIATLVLFSAWSLLRRAVGILMEGAPADVDPLGVERALLDIQGVRSVHDLHIWTLSSGFVALSAHLGVPEQSNGRGSGHIIHEAHQKLCEQFGIAHTTLQVEDAEAELGEADCRDDPRCLI